MKRDMNHNPQGSPVAVDGIDRMLYEQAAAWASASAALLAGVEALRTMQANTARELGLHLSAAAERYHNCGPGDSVLSIQNELLTSGVDGTVKYWKQTVATVADTSVRMLSAASQGFNTPYFLRKALPLLYPTPAPQSS